MAGSDWGTVWLSDEKLFLDILPADIAGFPLDLHKSVLTIGDMVRIHGESHVDTSKCTIDTHNVGLQDAILAVVRTFNGGLYVGVNYRIHMRVWEWIEHVDTNKLQFVPPLYTLNDAVLRQSYSDNGDMEVSFSVEFHGITMYSEDIVIYKKDEIPSFCVGFSKPLAAKLRRYMTKNYDFDISGCMKWCVDNKGFRYFVAH